MSKYVKASNAPQEQPKEKKKAAVKKSAPKKKAKE
jgi:hypothetical protein